MTAGKTLIVVNPKAGDGKALHAWQNLKHAFNFLSPYEEFITEKAGQITSETHKVLKMGFKKILVLGGDGSLTEAVNGYFENDKPIDPDAVIGLLPLGSGSDFLKNFDIKDLNKAIEALKQNRLTQCDVGKVTFTNHQHKTETRLFTNISSFGCAGEIVNRISRSSKPLGTKMAYFTATLSVFLTYKNPTIDLVIDGTQKKRVAINNFFVCNGKYSGGGMCWGPEAVLDDGLFDLTIVKDIPKIQGIMNMNKIYDGRAYEFRGLDHMRCKQFTATSDQTVPIEIDGDIAGTLPVKYEMLPDRFNFWY